MSAFIGSLHPVLGEWDAWAANLHKDSDYLLSWQLPAVALPCYLLVVAVLKIATDRMDKPFELKPALILHNGFLCILSFAMAFFTLAESLFNAQWSLDQLYCDSNYEVLTGRLWFWCFVFYLSKYLEFLDTVLLLLRKRPLLFLHVWHHSSIAVLCLLFMRTGTTFYWSGVVINATIHTFMYYYYAIASLGRTVSWKKWMTKGQLIQFCWGISSWVPYLFVCPNVSDESYRLQFINWGVLGSYLVLFMLFFRKTYSASKSAKGKKKQ